jgi:hypothetical protein
MTQIFPSFSGAPGDVTDAFFRRLKVGYNRFR